MRGAALVAVAAGMTLSAMAAVPARALSCLPPDALRSYVQAAAAPEARVVLLGDFTFDAPADLPDHDLSNPAPEEHRFPARFSGRALGPGGFTDGYALDLEVTLGCAGPWCAGVPADGSALAFVEMTSTGYALRLGPCGGQLFTAPGDGIIGRIEACHAETGGRITRTGDGTDLPGACTPPG